MEFKLSMTDSKKNVIEFLTDWSSISNCLEISEYLKVNWINVWSILYDLEEEKIISFSPNREWVSLNQ